jgi:MarR family transcriptional regulator for hemolysin
MKLLLEFGVTPARFDLMRILYGSGFSMPQMWLKARLGIARSTLSRMLKALEKLGLVARETDPWDRRTRKVTLTFEARSLVWRVLVALVRTRVIADVIDRGLLRGKPPVDVAAERRAVDSIAIRVLCMLARRGESVHVAFDAC